MRLLMMGTGPFALPTFRALYDTRHEMAALVTAPLRAHRGKPVAPICPIRQWAEAHGTPIFDPEDINTPDSRGQLATFEADLLVVCDYGQILSRATLATACREGINLHASLLPKYRGAAPINWALYHGETETGVTVIHMIPQIDAGPCLAQLRMSVASDETAVELESRLAKAGARLVCETIDLLEAGRIRTLPQDSALVSKAPRLKKTDGLINWSRPAVAIKNHIRAMEPWPKTYTFWHRSNGPPMRLIFGLATAVEIEGADVVPGLVIEATDDRLVIAAGEGAIVPSSVQPAGKRRMAVNEFLRGYHVRPGDRFGGERAGG